ncbi:MAG: hypothetical protein AAB320_05285 [Elusimicrobiota bacterium]
MGRSDAVCFGHGGNGMNKAEVLSRIALVAAWVLYAAAHEEQKK